MKLMNCFFELLGASSLRRRIIVMGLASAIVPVVCLMIMTAVQKQQLSKTITKDFNKITKDQLAALARQINVFCENQVKFA